MLMIDNLSRRLFRQRLPQTMKFLENIDKNNDSHSFIYDFLLHSTAGITSQVKKKKKNVLVLIYF